MGGTQEGNSTLMERGRRKCFWSCIPLLKPFRWSFTGFRLLVLLNVLEKIQTIRHKKKQKTNKHIHDQFSLIYPQYELHPGQLIRGTHGEKQEYKLDGIPVRYRIPCSHIHTLGQLFNWKGEGARRETWRTWRTFRKTTCT